MVIIENNETNSDKRKETYLAERSQRFYAFVLDALFSFSVSFAIPLILSPFIKDSDLIIALSLCSMIVGSIGAVIQSNLKRLLAYSSISHMGFILVGLVSFSESGLQAVLFYLTIYLFLLVGVFSIILSLSFLLSNLWISFAANLAAFKAIVIFGSMIF